MSLGRSQIKNLISTGGIIKNDHGNFVAAFSEFIGTGNSLCAELWAIMKGIEIAIAFNIKNLIIESNCFTVVNFLSDAKLSTHHLLFSRHSVQYLTNYPFLPARMVYRLVFGIQTGSGQP